MRGCWLSANGGRYPRAGIVPLSGTMDTAGPMARSVEDLVLLDSVITGQHAPVRPVRLKGLRLGVPRGFFYDNLDFTLAPVIENALAVLRQSGCVLVEADIPDLEQLSTSVRPLISYYEMFHDLARYLQESGANVDAKDVIAQIASPDVKASYQTFGIGPQAPSTAAYETALKHGRPAIQLSYRNYFRAHNVRAMVYPTTLLPPRPIGQDSEVELNGKKFPILGIYVHNTRPMTPTGIPGMSMPVGLTKDGLPVGLEFDGPAATDRELLAIGLRVEGLFGKLAAPKL
jgi:mandelamide amidase